jgi:hypothetical protein
VDPSLEALEAARATGARYLPNLVISWLEGDGLDVVPDLVDLIVCAQSRRGVSPDRTAGTASSDASAATQLVMPLAPDFVRLIEQAPTKLRPSGALICSFDASQQRTVTDLLARFLPAAYVWFEPQAGASFVVVAQLPRDPAWPRGVPDHEGVR